MEWKLRKEEKSSREEGKGCEREIKEREKKKGKVRERKSK